MHFHRIILQCSLVILVLYCTSCKKLVEVDAPSNAITGDNAFSQDITAVGLMNGIYGKLGGSSNFASGSLGLSIRAGLSADEFQLFAGADLTLIQFYKNSLTRNSATFWFELYNNIYTVNKEMEGVTASTTLTPAVKTQLLGEARFMRAFFYFHLVNLYGPVPLVTTTDYTENVFAGRTSVDEVYAQIVQDLKDAETQLSEQYLQGDAMTVSSDRVRPTKWAAKALLARVYLYTKKYAEAEQLASAVIDNSTQFTLVADLDNVFLANSIEAIWQVQPMVNDYNTMDGQSLVLAAPPNAAYPFMVGESLRNSFEVQDQRQHSWIGIESSTGTNYYFFNKYKIKAGPKGTEFIMVLRLAEQYLIRAEARAQQNNVEGAQEDLNAIRNRAGLDDTDADDQPSLLSAIEEERRHELFTEWGHRWFDLKRTERIDAVMTTASVEKGSTWSNDWKLYPITVDQININPNLSQNKGY